MKVAFTAKDLWGRSLVRKMADISEITYSVGSWKKQQRLWPRNHSYGVQVQLNLSVLRRYAQYVLEDLEVGWVLPRADNAFCEGCMHSLQGNESPQRHAPCFDTGFSPLKHNLQIPSEQSPSMLDGQIVRGCALIADKVAQNIRARKSVLNMLVFPSLLSKL